MDRASIQQILGSIASTGAAYLADPTPALGLRAQLLAHVQSLAFYLTDPQSTLLWLSWAEPARRAALVTALDLDIFPILAKETHVSVLAARAGAAPELLSRLLRHLAATQIIREKAADIYEATPLSQLLCDHRHAAAVQFSAAFPTPVLAGLPDFLRETGYVDPQQMQQTPFQHVMQSEKSPWEWAGEQPDLASVFALHMSGYHAGQGSWMDCGSYPVKERLIDGCRRGEHEVLLVDVGGGLGHDLEYFKEKFSKLMQGRRLVLQELKIMVKGAKISRPWIEAQVQDFFNKQPLEGARVYLLHSVLQDWRDQEALRILRNLKEAMQVGYSKVLIYEHIVPETGASWRTTATDLIMMGTGSRERTEKEWRYLIRASGLQIAAVWNNDQSSESLIEVILEETSKL